MSCLNDTGYKEGERIRAEGVRDAALIRQASAVAIAISNAQQLMSNYKLQRDIADRSLKIAEERQNFLRNVYWPRELAFLAEFGVPEELEEAEVLGKRYGGRLVASIAKTFAERLRREACNMSRYCTSASSKAFQDLRIQQAEVTTNARLLGRLIGFAEVRAREDRNYARRRQAVAIGRGLIARAASLYGSAGAGLAFAGKEISAGLASALETFGAAEAISERSVPRDATTSATPYDTGTAPQYALSASGYASETGRASLSATANQLYSIDEFLNVNAETTAETGTNYGGGR